MISLEDEKVTRYSIADDITYINGVEKGYTVEDPSGIYVLYEDYRLVSEINKQVYRDYLDIKFQMRILKESMPEPKESGKACKYCKDWGCNKCCSSDAEIRARQGIFG